MSRPNVRRGEGGSKTTEPRCQLLSVELFHDITPLPEGICRTGETRISDHRSLPRSFRRCVYRSRQFLHFPLRSLLDPEANLLSQEVGQTTHNHLSCTKSSSVLLTHSGIRSCLFPFFSNRFFKRKRLSILALKTVFFP
ncbi:hypothetical protein MPNT_160032 [Candidatus Methylacidithermus pantelleriae]|uniref:Uncharacterized protein n=1 Tax=Candidatus Methylacidithermus pantelleriae TaxID=2744239 RepID=A0A8J2FS77_9BACT|nr:hypothetical protein MPNT_160032 [Candidatus Methylacidithermus pantelleriae]